MVQYIVHSTFFSKSKCLRIRLQQPLLYAMHSAILAGRGNYQVCRPSILRRRRLHRPSPKFFRKLEYINTLSELAHQVPLTQIDIPPAVYQYVQNLCISRTLYLRPS